MRTLSIAVLSLSAALLAACGAKQGPAVNEPDLDAELAKEAEAKASGQGQGVAQEPKDAGKAKAPAGRLTRFDIDRGTSRNGAGFRVLARETPDGGQVIAFEFDGTLNIGEERYQGGKFGGVALASYGADGGLRWAKRLDHKDYHYVAALEVMADGDVLVGGSFGARGLILMRVSASGEERWTWQPEKEPKWAEVSNFIVDASGDIVLSGLFQATLQLPGQKPLKSRYFDGFLAKMDAANGELRWLRQMSSAEAKASAVYAAESGDIFVAGDYRKFLRVGDKELKGKRDFFIARFSPDGEVRYLAPVVARFVGNVIRVQPLEGELLALHLRGPEDSELVVVSESDGGIRWSVEDKDQGGALVYDARARPDALYYAVHETDTRFGSERMLIREIKGQDQVKTVRVIDAGPHLFMSRGTARRTAKGEFLIGGSLRDQAWDNDGFYPFVLALGAEARRVNLADMPSAGRGSGSRCKGEMPQKLVWRDLRIVVQQRARELGKCSPDPTRYGASFELLPDGTVQSVSIEGKADAETAACMVEVLQQVRVCPFQGGAYKRRLGQLR